MRSTSPMPMDGRSSTSRDCQPHERDGRLLLVAVWFSPEHGSLLNETEKTGVVQRLFGPAIEDVPAGHQSVRDTCPNGPCCSGWFRQRSVHDHAPDALALVHQVEALVDLCQRHGVRDHRVDLDLALHVPVDDFRHVGAAARATECRALPDASGHQLEWTGCDLRAGRGDADADGLAPAGITGYTRVAHCREVRG